MRARQSKGGGEEDQPKPRASRNSSEKAELEGREGLSWVEEREGEIGASLSTFFLFHFSLSLSLSTSNSRVDEELLGHATADDAAVVAGCILWV